MDSGRWTLLLRDQRRSVLRTVAGAILFLVLVAGGFESTPELISDVLDVFLFFFALWLVFSAGVRFGASTAEREGVGGRTPTQTG